jgi:hypothetical protein
MSFNVEEIRSLFPVLHQEVNGKPLIYFDNAATTQKPLSVLDALSDYYKKTTQISIEVPILWLIARQGITKKQGLYQRFYQCQGGRGDYFH